MKLFNANTATLLETLKLGANGYSGVMTKFQCYLYVWLLINYRKEPGKARELNDFITVSAFIEKQVYPVNAKYYLKTKGVLSSINTRVKKPSELNETGKSEVVQLSRLTDMFRNYF